ncbi:hypothetical protein N9J71_03045 [Ascidiaceihabitans sp.]|nr:hypothetical protein [Ascidiaceihabitans sp.]MDA9136017.1 hypothetical protein [Ascidiaceihabitans sp.]
MSATWVLTVSERKTIKDAISKPGIMASPPIRGVGRMWAACTADVSLRVVDLAVVSENPRIIIKHTDPEIKKLIANIWIRENNNVKLSQIKTILKTEVGVICLIMVFNRSFIYKQTVK